MVGGPAHARYLGVAAALDTDPHHSTLTESARVMAPLGRDLWTAGVGSRYAARSSRLLDQRERRGSRYAARSSRLLDPREWRGSRYAARSSRLLDRRGARLLDRRVHVHHEVG